MDTDPDAPVRLIVHCPAPFGSLRLNPLAPLKALEIVLAARAAGVRVERLPETGGQRHALDPLFEALAPHTATETA